MGLLCTGLVSVCQSVVFSDRPAQPRPARPVIIFTPCCQIKSLTLARRHNGCLAVVEQFIIKLFISQWNRLTFVSAELQIFHYWLSSSRWSQHGWSDPAPAPPPGILRLHRLRLTAAHLLQTPSGRSRVPWRWVPVSVLHSHWSRSNEAGLLLVESLIVLLAPTVLRHKEPASRIQRWFFLV